MLIPLDKIKPSPHPVRTSWDEDKMNELAQSIKEQGLIVPIKVREVCPVHGIEFLKREPNPIFEFEPDYDGDDYVTNCYGPITDEHGEVWPDSCWEDDTELLYEIVYGHRRVEACKRAELTHLNAWVEGVNDDDAHTMAGIENIVREDMPILDIVDWIQSEIDKGKTTIQVSRLVGKADNWASRVLSINKQSDEAKEVARNNPGVIKERHLRVARNDIVDPEYVAPILEKTVKEDLGWRQTEKIAKAIKEAPTDQAKKKLLEWEYSPTIHDPELIRQRKEKHGAHDPIYRDNKPSPQKAFDDSPEIKMLLDALTMAISTFLELIMQIKTVVEIGKLAPEGRQFMAHKLRSFRDKIDDLLVELED